MSKTKRVLPDLTKQVAYWLSTGASNKEIADRLNIQQPQVARLKKKAIQKKFVASAPACLLDDEEISSIEAELYGNLPLLEHLQNMYGGNLVDIFVVDKHYQQWNDPAHQDMMKSVARYLIRHVLPSANLAGVSWGPNLSMLATYITQLMTDRYEDKSTFDNLTFAQLSGDPPAAIANPNLRGSTLVSQLSSALSLHPDNQYTFSVSASIPSAFKDSEVETIRSYIQSIGGYKKIFNTFNPGQPRLRMAIDTLISSCGCGLKDYDKWVSDCAIENPNIENLVSGNIAGIWLPRQGLTGDERDALEKINTRWNGISMEDIRKISKQKKMGVICLALEPYKFDVVVKLLEQNLVTRLIINSEMASKLAPDTALAKR